MSEESTDLLTDGEVQAVIMALAYGKPEGFSSADAGLAVDWAERVRISEAMLKLVLQGKVGITVNDSGEVSLAGVLP